MIRVTPIASQSIVDLVLQEYGSITGLIPFARTNGIGIDADLDPTREYFIDPADIVRPEVVNEYKQQSLKVVEGLYIDVTT